MEEDIKILEDMRDKIYGEIQFVDEFDIEIECQKQFDALNLAINHLRKIRLVKSNYIPKSKIREKIEELEEERKKKDEENTIDVFYDQIDITHIIEVLQELLGDE